MPPENCNEYQAADSETTESTRGMGVQLLYNVVKRSERMDEVVENIVLFANGKGSRRAYETTDAAPRGTGDSWLIGIRRHLNGRRQLTKYTEVKRSVEIGHQRWQQQ